MKIAVFGDASGNIQSINDFCIDLEKKSGSKVDLVLQVGDLTIPKKEKLRIDQNVHKTYSDYLDGTKTFKFPAVFVKGHSEDFDLLYSRTNHFIDKSCKIFYLVNGEIFEFKLKKERLVIGGLGGNRSGTRDWEGNTIGNDKYFHKKELEGDRRRHFTIFEIEKLALQKREIDILLLHDSPLGFGKRRIPNFDEDGNPLPTGAKELTELVEAVQPKITLFGHYNNFSGDHRINNTSVIGLNSMENNKKAVLILDTVSWQYDILDID
ncbi:metallophosphoesterase [candidate division KSB1 bacterium]